MNANERTEMALQVAFNALGTAQAYGVLLESLIGVLKDNNILNHTKLDLLFRGAAATIDQAQPTDQMQKAAQTHMRQIVERVAKSAGIDIPLPGQTATPRKH